MTKHLSTEIEKLKKRILALCGMVEQNVYRAVRAVMQRDPGLAETVVSSDQEVDLMEVEVEEDCLKILALHQPVATDLRFIIAVLKINNDLERIGDLAVNIAQRARKLSTLERVEVEVDFPGMADKVKRLLKRSLEALVNLDVTIARDVLASDDEIDDLNRMMHQTIQQRILDDPAGIQQYVMYLSMSKNLERIADHATNIAEDVIYLVQGEIVRHAPVQV